MSYCGSQGGVNFLLEVCLPFIYRDKCLFAMHNITCLVSYSAKFSLVQNFSEMHPDTSEEIFTVYIFAGRIWDALTTTLPVDDHGPHANWRDDDEAKKQHVQQWPSLPFARNYKAGLKEAYSSCSMSFHKATLALRWHAHAHPVLPLTLWPLLECRSGPETALDWVPQAGWCMSTCDQTYSWEGVHREGMYTIIPEHTWIQAESLTSY